jgi:hypothetical protein
LFDRSTAWCVEHKVLLPGVTTMARLVTEVRATAIERLWFSLYGLVSDPLRRRLEGLLVVPDDARVSELERLRVGPTRLSAAEMTRSLARLAAVQDLGAGGLDLTAVPAGRLAALARYGMAAPAGALRQMTVTRRTATLLATLQRLETQTADEVLDVFELLYANKIEAKAQRASVKERLGALVRLSRAASRMAAGWRVVLDLGAEATMSLPEVWAAVEAVAAREQLAAAVGVIDDLVPDDEDDQGAKRAELVKRFATLRSFWTAMIDVMPFEAAEGGKAVLAAAQALPALFGRKKVAVSEIDESVLAGSWRRLVLQSADLDAGLVDWRAYTLAVAESLHHALRRRDVFVLGAGRWGDGRGCFTRSCRARRSLRGRRQRSSRRCRHGPGCGRVSDPARRRSGTTPRTGPCRTADGTTPPRRQSCPAPRQTCRADRPETGPPAGQEDVPQEARSDSFATRRSLNSDGPLPYRLRTPADMTLRRGADT